MTLKLVCDILIS